jgi:hypothetical protein
MTAKEAYCFTDCSGAFLPDRQQRKLIVLLNAEKFFCLIESRGSVLFY